MYVCVGVCKSALLARVRSQHFEIMPDDSPSTSVARPYVMNTVWMEIVALRLKARRRRVNITSGCETRDSLYFARMPRLTMGRMKDRVYIGMFVLS